MKSLVSSGDELRCLSHSYGAQQSFGRNTCTVDINTDITSGAMSRKYCYLLAGGCSKGAATFRMSQIGATYFSGKWKILVGVLAVCAGCLAACMFSIGNTSR